MKVEEMRAKATETGHTDPIWAVGAEICERLEQVLEALMEEVAFEDMAMPQVNADDLTARLALIPRPRPDDE